jgi:hypothetical protein
MNLVINRVGGRIDLPVSHTNERLLTSELEWLDRQLEQVFAVDFKKDEDYSIPCKWAGARSRTVVLLSERTVEAFPHLVLGLAGNDQVNGCNTRISPRKSGSCGPKPRPNLPLHRMALRALLVIRARRRDPHHWVVRPHDSLHP